LASEETGQFLVLRENKVYFIGCIERAFSREETGQQATEREGLATEETDHQALVLREKTVYDIGCIESAFTREETGQQATEGGDCYRRDRSIACPEREYSS